LIREGKVMRVLPGFLCVLALAMGACDSGSSATSASSTAPTPPKGAEAAEPAQDPNALVIWWAQWPPADGLQKLGDEYASATGQKVKVFQIPWSDFQNKTFQEFGKSRTAFDMVLGDSQWVGRGAEGKLYLELTDWIAKNVDLKSFHPKAVKGYCEYPPGSARYYAVPAETDAMGFAYRKDWFEDPKEKEAFKAKHGRELGVPKTWEEFEQVAAFFTRPDKNVYGCSLVNGRMYDDIVNGFGQVLYAFGGSWGDEKTRKVKGHLDSANSLAALEFFKKLSNDYSPKGGSSYDYFKSLDAFKNGSVAIHMNMFAFFPGLVEQYKEKVGFFPVPSKGDRRVTTLGGQGISISAKVPAEKQEAAKKFIAWLIKTDTQKKWVAMPACFTGNAEILKSEEFRKASPYNAAFADSLDVLQDFWNVPCYNELIAASLRHLGEAVDGKTPPAEALKKLAEEHETLMKENGLLK
jgi:multiple sugar transport system substrate-binding protein